MNKLAALGLTALISLLASCGPQSTTDVKMHVIFDNPSPRTMPLALFGEVPDSLVAALKIADGVPSSVSVMLVEKDGQQLLFDAGNGTDDSQMMPALQKLGVTASDIDAVFITHLHGDHIGGLLKEGKRVFENARLYIAAPEVEAWKSQENVMAMLDAYQGSVVRFDATDELPGGVKAIPAYGHTPGHTVYRVGDMLIVGDIMHGLALQMKHPEFCARFDMDREKAVEARKFIMEMVKEEGWKMYGMHFPTTEAVVME